MCLLQERCMCMWMNQKSFKGLGREKNGYNESLLWNMFICDFILFDIANNRYRNRRIEDCLLVCQFQATLLRIIFLFRK